MPSRDAPAGDPSPRSRAGLWCGVVVVGFALSAGLVGLAPLVQLGYTPGAVVVAAVLLRRRDAAYLEFCLLLWLATPEVRRVADYGTAWHPTSVVMLAPPLTSLLGLLPALLRTRPLRHGADVLWGAAVLSLGYGGAVGVLRGGLGPAAAGALNWLPGVALGLYLANAGPSTEQAKAALLRVATLGCTVLGVYGIVQFIVVPPWDAFWVANAGLNSLGKAESGELRTFSLLNSPGPFATTIGALLTLLVGVGARGRTLALVLGLAGLGLSLVRGAWLAFVLAALLLLARSGARGLVRVGGALLVPVLVLVAVGGPVTKVVTERFADTSSAGAKDRSLEARTALYRRETVRVLADPFGQGLGSTGTATKIGNNGRLSDTGNFDSGLLEYPYTYGALVGTGFLLVLVGSAWSAWTRVGRRDEFRAAAAAAVLGLVLQAAFGSVSTSVSGAVLWTLLGLLSRREPGDAPDDALASDPPTRAATPVARPSRRTGN